MTTYLVDQIELTTINCGECGAVYAINERFRKQCHEKGTAWNCPYCKCGWGYTNNSLLAQEKKKREAAERSLAYEESRHAQTRATLKTTERRRRATKGQLTRTKKKLEKGECPCCSEQFDNLREHMESSHPDYVSKPQAAGDIA